MDKRNNLIMTAITPDEKYYNNIIVLLQSIKDVYGDYPPFKVVIYYLNGAQAPSELSSIRFQDVLKSCITFIEVVPQCKSIRDYSNMYRATAFKSFMCGIYDAIMWIDSDCIIRGEIDELLMMPDGPAVKIMQRETPKEYARVQNGVIVINDYPETRELILQWEKMLSVDSKWYSDQLWMYRLLIQSGMNTIHIDEKYNDWHFNDGSVIWHCKGSHAEEEPFNSEYRRLLNATTG